MAAQDFALIVGVRDYPDYSNLTGPVDDAQKLVDWVKAKNGGDVPGAQVFSILSHPAPPTPLQHVIDNAIKVIKADVAKNHGSRARRLYFYFSGHGLAGENDDNSLCMADWSYDMRNSALSSREYLNYLVNTGHFEEIVFFLDCCRSRLVGHRSHFPNLGLAKPSPLAGSTKTIVFYASEFQNAAFEVQNNGDSISFVHGHFTNALLRALAGEAVDEDGNVTGEGVGEFLTVEIPRLAKDFNQFQEAKIQTSNLNPKKLVFATVPKRGNPTCTITFQGRNGMIRLEDGDYKVIKQGDATTGPWTLQLEPKAHSIKEISTGEEKDFKVLATGKTQSFEF